jgi:hypothetical protein
MPDIESYEPLTEEKKKTNAEILVEKIHNCKHLKLVTKRSKSLYQGTNRVEEIVHVIN